LLGHIRDTGQDPRAVRTYRTAAAMSYHADAADLVGLLCLETARRGGMSRFVSSITVYNTLLAEHPELVDRLYEPFLYDTHGEGGVDFISSRAATRAAGCARSGQRLPRRRTSTSARRARAARERCDRRATIASRPELYLEMEFARATSGCCRTTIIHCRSAYEDHDRAQAPPARLWISLESRAPLRERITRLRSGVPMLLSLARARIDRAVRGPQRRRSS
jgi:hypothetical protein